MPVLLHVLLCFLKFLCKPDIHLYSGGKLEDARDGRPEELCSRGTPACPSCACHGYALISLLCEVWWCQPSREGWGRWGKIYRAWRTQNSACYMRGRAEVTSQGQAESFLRARPVAPLGLFRRWSVESVCLRLLPGKALSLWTGLSSSQKRQMWQREFWNF